jgi:hypothetical protein
MRGCAENRRIRAISPFVCPEMRFGCNPVWETKETVNEANAYISSGILPRLILIISIFAKIEDC